MPDILIKINRKNNLRQHKLHKHKICTRPVSGQPHITQVVLRLEFVFLLTLLKYRYGTTQWHYATQQTTK